MADFASNKDTILDQFSQQAESYARLVASMQNDDRKPTMRDLTGAGPDDLVLDVCCGTGALALELAPFVLQVTGLDITPAMLDQARAAQQRKGVVNVDWVQGDAFGLPYATETFTLVICSTAFHHLPDPRAALSEMVRVCRIGGRIAVRDITPDAAKSTAFDRMERLRDPSHEHALSLAELAALGEGMAVGVPSLHISLAADIPLSAVLETAFPETCTIEDIRAEYLDDARTGADQLGYLARLADGEILVSYAVSTAIWIKL
jgi:ubiquinone/menaquinone biosynthesis C-methylase UbiE